MSECTFLDASGNPWVFNVDEISIGLRMWAQAKANIQALIIRTSSDDDALQEVHFDNQVFTQLRNQYHEEEMAKVSVDIYNTPETILNQLTSRYRAIPRLERQLRSIYNRHRRHNSNEITQRVSRGQVGVDLSRGVRDISASIFMCCIPLASLGFTAGMMSRLGVSIFQATSSYRDSQNEVGVSRSASAAAGLATAVLTFTSTLMVLPRTAEGAVKIVFNIVNIGNTAVSNSAINMITLNRNSSRTFTNILGEQLIAGIGQEATGSILGAIEERLVTRPLGAIIQASRERGNAYLSSQIMDRVRSRNTPGRRLPQTINRQTISITANFGGFHITPSTESVYFPSLNETTAINRMLRRVGNGF